MTDTPLRWSGRPYYSLDHYLKNRFGEKVYKVSLDGGFTCPNRDGTLGTDGCIFCSEGGSGDFASDRSLSITDQITEGIRLIRRYKNTGSRYIAYFQAFTGTYDSPERLRRLYRESINHPDVVMLSIATRPDCLEPEILDLLHECSQIKPVLVELGLQTIHQKSITYIRRGYPNSVYERAVSDCHHAGLEVVTHVIAGLPGESKEDFLATVNYATDCQTDGIKLQLLHVLAGTDLGRQYEKEPFPVLSMEEYLDWITDAVCYLPPEVVIHRLTGDGPKDLLLAPLWSAAKREVLNRFHHRMKEENLWQSKYRSTKGSI